MVVVEEVTAASGPGQANVAVVKSVLAGMGIHNFSIEDQPMRVNFGVTRKNGVGFTCSIQLQPQPTLDLVTVFVQYNNVQVPGPKRGLVSIYLTKCNYGLNLGNFEMDLDDGEVRYKTVLVLPGPANSATLTSSTLEYALKTSLAMAEAFYPGCMDVMHTNKNPLKAYQECMATNSSRGTP
jgi:hypothetical protein